MMNYIEGVGPYHCVTSVVKLEGLIKCLEGWHLWDLYIMRSIISDLMISMSNKFIFVQLLDLTTTVLEFVLFIWQ